MTDAALIERFLKGDIGAFNTLVWRWEKPIFNFILRTVGNEDTAKDICQTTFIRMFKQLKTLREPDKFSPWIYRIALNLCRDEFKKKNRNHLLYFENYMTDDNASNMISQMSDQNGKTPEEFCNHQQLKEILKQALMSIPEEQRVIIIMKQYQGLKFTEISDILKQPINTTKSRLYYGLRALRKTLEESKYSKEVLLNEM
ncbi:MAG: sigma-70 family RNA polymerase sigma factor [bacterium]